MLNNSFYKKNDVNSFVKVQIGLRLLRKNETVNELGNFYIITPPLAPPPTGRSTLCKQRGGENKEYSYFSSPLPKGNSTRRRRGWEWGCSIMFEQLKVSKVVNPNSETGSIHLRLIELYQKKWPLIDLG